MPQSWIIKVLHLEWFEETEMEENTFWVCFFFITMFFITNNQSDVFTLVSYILNSINLLLKCLKMCCVDFFFLKRLNGLIILI